VKHKSKHREQKKYPFSLISQDISHTGCEDISTAGRSAPKSRPRTPIQKKRGARYDKKNPHAGFSPVFFQTACDSCVGDKPEQSTTTQEKCDSRKFAEIRGKISHKPRENVSPQRSMLATSTPPYFEWTSLSPFTPNSTHTNERRRRRIQI